MVDQIQTVDPRQVLQPIFLEGIIEKKLEQELIFENMFPKININELSFTYMKDISSATEDIMSGLQGKPGLLNEVGTLSDIEVSSIDVEYGSMQRVGYKMSFAKSILRESTVIDEISRAVDRAAYGMAQYANQAIVSTIMNIKNQVNEYVTDVKWDSVDANPVQDILKILESTLLPEYPYMLTDLFLHQTQYFQLLSYIQNKPYVPWTQSPFKNDVEVPTINGVRIHNIGQLVLDDGDYIGIDSRYPGITVFQYIDPDISSKGSININQVTELNYPFNVVTEFFSESGYAPKLPNALYYAEKAL